MDNPVVISSDAAEPQNGYDGDEYDDIVSRLLRLVHDIDHSFAHLFALFLNHIPIYGRPSSHRLDGHGGRED